MTLKQLFLTPQTEYYSVLSIGLPLSEPLRGNLFAKNTGLHYAQNVTPPYPPAGKFCFSFRSRAKPQRRKKFGIIFGVTVIDHD